MNPFMPSGSQAAVSRAVAAWLLLVLAVTAMGGRAQAAVDPTPAGTGTVSPSELSMTLILRDEGSERLRVDLRSFAGSPVDVLFLLDASRSAGWALEEVRQRANEIMTRLSRASSNNLMLAVATVTDYGSGAGPWRLLTGLTFDRAVVLGALRAIQVSGGGDRAEAYTRALSEARSLRWRPHARHFIILFADAPARDPDPGPDGRLGSGDDLALHDVLTGLAGDHIAVVALSMNADEPARGQLEQMARATGGLAAELQSASEILDPILATIGHDKRPPTPTLVSPDSYSGWFTTEAPVPVRRREGFVDLPFLVHPPRDAFGRTYRIPLIVTSGPGGAELGTTLLTLRLGVLSLPWAWALLPLPALAFLVLLRRAGHERGLPAPDYITPSVRPWIEVGFLIGLLGAVVATWYLWQWIHR